MDDGRAVGFHIAPIRRGSTNLRVVDLCFILHRNVSAGDKLSSSGNEVPYTRQKDRARCNRSQTELNWHVRLPFLKGLTTVAFGRWYFRKYVWNVHCQKEC